ncbi:hypothetical protein [Streptomyces sp. enrichment culture]|uniref:hypothetical protein n=1 Tax=Streptomyces sp. enrichment culture TaxID=1795815 RepID=UPI003F567511
MPAPRADLSTFAASLADRLPGTWTSDYQHHAQDADHSPRTEQLWDVGHVEYIVSRYVLIHDAVLHGPADQRLYVTDRPRYPHQFVVAPLIPTGTHIKPHHLASVKGTQRHRRT